MKILLTAFEPFDGEIINSALETMKGIRDDIHGCEVVKLKIPTVFHKASRMIAEQIETVDPDILLSLGQAGGREGITIEFVGINWMDGRIPDNEGNQPVGEKISSDGENAYFSTLPVKDMVKAMNQKKIPSKISYTAGTFVCNEVLYSTLYFIQKYKKKTKAGFIHLPYSKEQTKGKAVDTPFMAIDDMVVGIETALQTLL